MIGEVEFEVVDIVDDSILAPISILDEMLVNGGAKLAALCITNAPAIAYEAIDRPGTAERFYQHMLTSEAFTKASEEMLSENRILKELDIAKELREGFVRTSPFGIDGFLAERLYEGGAYYDFVSGGPEWEDAPETYGTAADAKRIAESFVETAFECRFGDLLSYQSKVRWCEWFCKLHFDNWTMVVVDRRYKLIWVLCLTDTD